ncbi:Ribosomal RNA small subunit methyltransferase, mitochondrial [Sesamum angolense]|uniref:rRNA adenine N(6)-methyltransferase n=1 Tax=Sesamum angolense TaxID=2727404 RepID=A0AAE1T808_9LAMI|nr:Ribosomal RNA small subunit methyltransferase, mitochondrial [Sesamum angolense]
MKEGITTSFRISMRSPQYYKTPKGAKGRCKLRHDLHNKDHSGLRRFLELEENSLCAPVPFTLGVDEFVEHNISYGVAFTMNALIAQTIISNKILSGDALKTKFPEFNLVVANIPYGISSPLLAKLVYGANVNPFRSATLLLQKEFARRLLAKPGDSEFNRLAVNMKLVAEVEFVMDVSKRDFVPCPKVDSSVVKIYPKSEIPDVDLEEWWAFTRTCFSKKNKTLGATLKQKRKLMELMKLSKAEVFSDDHDDGSNGEGDEECDSDEGSSDSSLSSGTGIGFFRTKIVRILESGGFLEKRPSKLSNDELLQLLSLLNGAGIYFHDGTKKKNTCEAAFAACDDLL